MTTPESRSRLIRIKKIINEDSYKVDVILLDRYVAFSAEILRLALASLAALGFGITLLLGKNSPLPVTPVKSCSVLLPLVGGVVVLVITVGLALAHRFIASEGFFHHTVALRYANAPAARGDENALTKLSAGVGQYKTAERCLRLSAFGLACGASLLIVGIVAYLFGLEG